MKVDTKIEENKNLFLSKQLIYRLIAVWVISEGVAGGILHALHLPFTGLILSSFAVVCICLIGFAMNYQGNSIKNSKTKENTHFLFRGSILKATIIVCIFKMMLSPNSPPPAYFAVLFQGIIGQILFSRKFNFKISCMILGFLALVESAVQGILILVIIYGTDFWSAVNEFIKRSLGVEKISNYALFLALVYILIHAIIGLYIGFKAAKLVRKTHYWKQIYQKYMISDITQLKIESNPKRKKRGIKKIFYFLWIVLILLILQSAFKIGTPVISQHKALLVFLRSLLIVFTWYLLISPLLSIWIKKKLRAQENKTKNDIAKTLVLLPNTEKLFRRSWQLSSAQKNGNRFSLFWKILWINILTVEIDST